MSLTERFRFEFTTLLFWQARQEWEVIGADDVALPQGKEANLSAVMTRLSADGWAFVNHARAAAEPSDIILLQRPVGRITERLPDVRKDGVSALGLITVEAQETPWVHCGEMMLERGVEGHWFNPHMKNDQCEAMGCRPLEAGWIKGSYGAWGPPPKAPVGLDGPVEERE
jgi:hypothetical protein